MSWDRRLRIILWIPPDVVLAAVMIEYAAFVTKMAFEVNTGHRYTPTVMPER